uniref:two-component system sensor histidine kinase NtrB n=1 Tax=Achromobacter sp. TaxID=134375 RepID=UPI0031DBD086
MTSLPDFPSEDRYRLLVGAVRDYAIYLLDANGRVSSWNPGAERFKGYGADEIIGQHFSVFYTPEDQKAGVPERALETARREGRFEAEGWRVRKDGSTFWCSVVIDPVHDDRGVLVGYAKITRDITEQKERHEQLQEARDSMHHAQRMDAIGRLTGGVAHDFNNFLTAIRFSAEFIKRYPELPPSLMRYVGIIIDTTEKAAQLTRQLLAYAKRQPLQPHAFDVRDSLASMRELFETSVGSHVAISYEFGPGDCTIFADPAQLESALLNLVINARDAMPSGGQLKIMAQVVPDASDLEGHTKLNGPHVALSVQDTGAGIAPGVLAHVFEPFFTTKGQHENSGLGLSQVQGFVQQSGGDVTVDSTVGKGTTFTLYLPAVTSPGEVVETPAAGVILNVPVVLMTTITAAFATIATFGIAFGVETAERTLALILGTLATRALFLGRPSRLGIRLFGLGNGRGVIERRIEICLGILDQARAELVAQRAAAHLEHMAFRQLTELERAVGDADQAVDLEAERAEHVLDFAVLAFAQAHSDPDVGSLRAVERRVDRAIEHSLDGNAFLQLVQRFLIDLTMSAH